MSLQQKVKTKILTKLNQGYTKDDVSRHCLVHSEVVDKILEDEKVPLKITEQMFTEL